MNGFAPPRGEPAAARAAPGSGPRRRPGELVALVWRSAACTLSALVRGIDCQVVTCEGRLPRFHASGSVRFGRIAVRGATVPVELGASAGGRLEIGARTFINQGATIVARCLITIGEDVRVGDFVAIYDTDYHPVDEVTPVRTLPVRIGDNVWIGRGAVVLPGVTIGDHAVVAAGSLVTADVSERTLVAGNPARHLRDLSATEGWKRP